MTDQSSRPRHGLTQNENPNPCGENRQAYRPQTLQAPHIERAHACRIRFPWRILAERKLLGGGEDQIGDLDGPAMAME